MSIYFQKTIFHTTLFVVSRQDESRKSDFFSVGWVKKCILPKNRGGGIMGQERGVRYWVFP